MFRATALASRQIAKNIALRQQHKGRRALPEQLRYLASSSAASTTFDYSSWSPSKRPKRPLRIDKEKFSFPMDTKQNLKTAKQVLGFRGITFQHLKDIQQELVSNIFPQPKVHLMVTNRAIPEVGLEANETVQFVGQDANFHNYVVRHPRLGDMILPFNFADKKAREDWTMQDLCDYIIKPKTLENQVYYTKYLEEHNPGALGDLNQGSFLIYARKMKLSAFICAIENSLSRQLGEDSNVGNEIIYFDIIGANQPLLDPTLPPLFYGCSISPCVNKILRDGPNHTNITVGNQDHTLPVSGHQQTDSNMTQFLPRSAKRLKNDGDTVQLKQSAMKYQAEVLHHGLHHAIRRFDGVKLVLDHWDNPSATKRAWCLWEMVGALKASKTVEVWLTKDDTERFSHVMMRKYESIIKAILDIDVMQAKCMNKADHTMIMAMAGDHAPRINLALKDQLRAWFAETAKYHADKYSESSSPSKLKYAAALYSRVGMLMQSLGNYDTAEEYFRLGLEVNKENLGKHHPYTGKSYHHLASLLQERGRWKEARRYSALGMSLVMGGTGKLNLYYAASLDRHASLLEEQGHFTEAEELNEKALDIRRTQLGERNPLTLRSLHALGRLMLRKGCYQIAGSLFDQVYAQRHLLAPDAKACLYNRMIQNLVRLGKYDDAETICQEMMYLVMNAYSHSHPIYAMALENYGEVFKKTANYKTAEIYFKDCLKIREAVLGIDHPRYAGTLHLLGKLQMRLGKYEDSRNTNIRALKIRQRVLGKFHPDTATSMNRLAVTLDRLDHFEEAKELILEAMSVRRQTVGENHVLYASSLHTMASFQQNQGFLELAIPNYKRALGIKRRAVGKHHPTYANTLHSLAGLYARTGDLKQSKKLLEEGLDIFSGTIGKNHSDYITTLISYARCLGRLGHYAKAEQVCKNALEARLKLFWPYHPEIAAAQHCLGTLSYRQGSFDDAIQWYESALTARRTTLGPYHHETAKTQAHLGFVLRKVGQEEKGTQLQESAKATWTKTFPNANANNLLNYLLSPEGCEDWKSSKKSHLYCNECQELKCLCECSGAFPMGK